VLFRRAYDYEANAAGLKGVPIPVWATKAFTATWEAPLKQLPFEAKLEYDLNDQEKQVFGTVKSNLPVDLEDVCLVYGKQWIRLSDLPQGAKPEKVVWRDARPADFQQWAAPGGQFRPDAPHRPYNPGQILKELLFHERTDLQGRQRNFEQRGLDQSWRLREDWRQRDAVTREAILVARLPRAHGSAEGLTGANDPRLPTHLWLDELPREDPNRPGKLAARPRLAGSLVQDTYVRVYLPVTPKK